MLIQRVIDRYRPRYNPAWAQNADAIIRNEFSVHGLADQLYAAETAYSYVGEVAIYLLNHLGKKREALKVAREAVEVILLTLRRGHAQGSYSSHNIAPFLRMLDRTDELPAILLENHEFEKAVTVAQKEFEGDTLKEFYRALYATAKNAGYNNGFPVQLEAAELLGDKKLVRGTKRAYLAYRLAKGDGPVNLAKDVGTRAQLRKAYQQQIDGLLDSAERQNVSWKELASTAAEAYQRFPDDRYYALQAMEAYVKISDFRNALTFARHANSPDAERYAVLVEMMPVQ